MNIEVVNDKVKNRSSAVLGRTMKAVETDGKISKETVLGLFSYKGDKNEIIRALSATKFKCKYTVQPVRTVICEETK